MSASAESGGGTNDDDQNHQKNQNLYFAQPNGNMMLLTQYAQKNDTPDFKTTQNYNELVAVDNNYFEIIPIDSNNVFSASSNGFNQVQVPYYGNEGERVNDGLAVLEILYNQQLDTPEFIDVNDLGFNRKTSKPEPGASPEFIDVNNLLAGQRKAVCKSEGADDDDVIFVAEYTQSGKENCARKEQSTSDNPPRRNPVRKARKSTKYLTQDVLYDGDLTILDSSTDEDEIITVDYDKGHSNLPLKDYKKWPVNGLHERPEYNDTTKTLEKFDYTIRQIKTATEKKIPKQVKALAKSKPKKKMVTRRKRKHVDNVQKETVRASDLQDTLLSTLTDVVGYIKNVKTMERLLEKTKPLSGLEDCENVSPNVERNKNEAITSRSIELGLDLLKRQAVLYKVTCGATDDDVKQFLTREGIFKQT